MRKLLLALTLAPLTALAGTYADVLNGIVTNIVIWNGSSPYTPPDGGTLVISGPNAQVGATYSGGVFTAPSAPATPQGIMFADTPTAGTTVNLPCAPQPQAVLYAYFTPASTLATLNVVLCTAPQDGDVLYILSTKAITSMTITTPSGVQLLGFTSPVAISAGVSAHITYSAQLTGWFHL